MGIMLSLTRQEEERIAQESLEMLVQSQAKRRREEEVKRAKLMASEMQWYSHNPEYY